MHRGTQTFGKPCEETTAQKLRQMALRVLRVLNGTLRALSVGNAGYCKVTLRVLPGFSAWTLRGTLWTLWGLWVLSGKGEPGPGADVARASKVPAQTRQGCGQSRRTFGVPAAILPVCKL
jgi:hypothetical protein